MRYSSFFYPFLLGISLLAWACGTAQAKDATSYNRELAKNGTGILIIASGPEAQPVAEQLRQSIADNPDFKRKRKPQPLHLATLADAPALLAGPFANATVITFLAARDQVTAASVPAPLLDRLPLNRNMLGTRLSAVRSVQTSSEAGKVAFRIGFYAPDRERLMRLFQNFDSRRPDDYRRMGFEETHLTNRVALFSAPELRPALTDWGKRPANAGMAVWNEVQWYDLAERTRLTPEQLAECTEVYFINRSHGPEILPEPVKLTLDGVTLSRTLVAFGKRAVPEDDTLVPVTRDENPTLVVSAPSQSTLLHRIQTYRNVPSLLRAPAAEEAIDLTMVNDVSLLVVSPDAAVTSGVVEGVYAEIGRRLRNDFGFAVNPRGILLKELKGEVVLQLARSKGADAAEYLSKEVPTRYVWVFSMTQVDTGTLFKTDERKLTPGMEPFTQAEPERPRRAKDEKYEDYQERVERYTQAHNDWETRRSVHNDRYFNTVCEWELALVAERKAEVRGLLQLIDLKGTGNGLYLWEESCSFTATDRETMRVQKATVTGHGNRPTPLEAPPAEASVPAKLLLNATLNAIGSGLNRLRQNALFPSEVAPLEGSLVASPAANPVKAPTLEGKVADIIQNRIYLNIGAKSGVQKGDRFQVILGSKQIKDPDTQALLHTIEYTVVTEVVEVLPNTSSLKLVNPADQSKLVKIKRGMAVRR